MDGWMKGRKDRWKEGRYGWREGRRRVSRRKDEWMDKWMGG